MAKQLQTRWWIASFGAKLTLLFFSMTLFLNYLFFIGNIQGFMEETQNLILKNLLWVSYSVVLFALMTIVTTFFSKYLLKKKIQRIVFSVLAIIISSFLYVVIGGLMVWLKS